MATGLTLTLHLLELKHQQNHDSNHCSIYQQLLIKSSKFIAEPELSIPDIDLFKDYIEFPIQFYVTAFHHKPFNPRPPPYCVDKPALILSFL